jgi:hypothetical protein
MMPDFDGVKVFTATLAAERERLGEAVTRWIQGHPEREPVRAVVTQSSDHAFLRGRRRRRRLRGVVLHRHRLEPISRTLLRGNNRPKV